MTAIAGYAGALKIGANQVLEIDKWDVNIDSDIYDTSSYSNAWKNQIAGLRKWSGTCSGRLYQGDTTGQAAIQSALIGGTSVSVSFYIDGTHNYSGTAYVKQIQIKSSVTTTVDFSCTFEGTGVISYV